MASSRAFKGAWHGHDARLLEQIQAPHAVRLQLLGLCRLDGLLRELHRGKGVHRSCDDDPIRAFRYIEDMIFCIQYIL